MPVKVMIEDSKFQRLNSEASLNSIHRIMTESEK